MVLGWGCRSWMECDLHLPRVLTPPKGSHGSRQLLEDLQLGCTSTWIWPCEEQHLCLGTQPPSLKAPWTRSGRGIPGSKMSFKRMLLVAQNTPISSDCLCWSISLLPSVSSTPLLFHLSVSLNYKWERTFSPVSAPQDPPAFPWVSFQCASFIIGLL